MLSSAIKNSLHSSSLSIQFKSRLIAQIFAALAATLSAFGMGTVEAYTSPALPDMRHSEDLLGHISEKQYAHVASFALLAALLSGFPTALLLQTLGRKGTIMLISVPFVTGWLMIAFAVNITMINAGRILTGFCAGSISLVVPIFLGELAEDRIRGFLGSSFQIQVTSGNLFVYVLGKYLNWQWLAFSCSLVVLIGILLMSFVPASPRFLLSKGNYFAAARSLAWLRGAKSISQIEDELQSMQKSVELSRQNRHGRRDYLRLPVLRPLSISLLLLFFQQMTGVEAILVFTLDIFKFSGSPIDLHSSVIIVGSLQVTATIFSSLIVDRVGRRILLIISSAGTCTAMIGLGIWFYYLKAFANMSRLESHLYWIPLLTMAFFIIFFALGLGPIPFIMIAELNNAEMIGIASAIATTFNWAFAFLVTRCFLSIAHSVGFHFLFWGFAMISLLGIGFIFMFVPETKGKSMQEIQRYFNGN